MEPGKIALDLMFPPRCPVCGGIIPVEDRFGIYGLKNIRWERGDLAPYICGACVQEFAFIEQPFCVKCGKQLFRSQAEEAAKEGKEALCYDCTKKDRGYKACRCLMSYDGLAREVLKGIKYLGRSESAVMLGRLAAKRLGGWISSISPDFIVPVPIHRERLKKRGYNQAGIIAAEIGAALGVPVLTDILKRGKNTHALKELDVSGRFMAIHDAFIADTLHSSSFRELVKAKKSARRHTKIRHAADICRMTDNSDGINVPADGLDLTALIVDDIYTTGSTLDACANCLTGAGISSVYGLCIASGTDVIKA